MLRFKLMLAMNSLFFEHLKFIVYKKAKELEKSGLFVPFKTSPYNAYG